ncbi:hypothetical protein BKE30_07415 [Alkanindiges hydrocarboniclasticus]|jgi:hypothetical protein|uniref:BLUF domain-containing protein n=1 Tax=Alkanindiges hydrocarboniclasticus TaxID=1907941 RepID=A0A1S8CUE0_9GAMM|nr:BLUF domain-containing protein [Alkanindiges hydrocarboniclasticus]ONG40563.1 hypothetical protein BKE30_07415 [Alkanindiges hydrocarboniclasticus]
MQSCERVVFISTISAELIDTAETIRQFREDGIAYHVRDEVTGLLLYGDSYIFHCFESRHGGMDKLKQTVMTYPYHHNQKLIYDKANVESRFNSWSMVCVVTETQIQDFINKHRWSTFNPYLLDGALLDEFMEVIYSYGDNHKTALIHPAERLVKSQQGTDQQSIKKKTPYGLAVIALTFIISLIVYGWDYFGVMLDDW